MSAGAVAVALTGADQAVTANAGVYRGFALRETAGAAAVVRIYDNASAGSGTLIDSVRLAANESLSAWLSGGGIRVSSGIFVDVVSGAVEGSIRIG